jgi:hypothetical protein
MKKPFSINNIEIKDDVIILQSYTYDRKTFYVDRENFSIHTSMPITEDNIANEEICLYIINGIRELYSKKESELNRISSIISKLTFNYYTEDIKLQ